MSEEQQAMPKPGGDVEQDAKGAMKDGEDQRGDQESAPRPLGRKDPQESGGSAAGVRRG